MNHKYKNKQRLKFALTVVFLILIIGLIIANFLSFRSYQNMGILTIIPFDSLLFQNVGIILLGIACFSILQLYQYKTGRLFALYALLLGLSISLAPCNRLNEFVLSFFRAIFTLGSSILLFQVVGYLALLRNRMLFKILQAALVGIAALSMMAQILAFFGIGNYRYILFAEESVNSCVVLSAVFSVVVVIINYKKSNSYTRKQSKTLIFGIGAGILLFFAMSVIPNMYLVQNRQTEKEVFVEISMSPAETMLRSLPLLLFSGISIAIIFALLHRAFSVDDIRLKSSWFVSIPLYFGLINILLFLYANAPIWVMVITNILLLMPLLAVLWKLFNREENMEELCELRLMCEVEKEKQELSAYLHDEVLQSLIAFYRKVQSDESGQYSDMKLPLSNLITQIRSVSHNLYPTMVEDLGLEQSLDIFIEEIQNHYPDMNMAFHYKFTEGILPKAYALAIYRISKELVTNAAKHSGGMQIKLLLEEDTDGYYIQVQDNGTGFHTQAEDTLLKSPHMGLYTVKRQIAGLTGRMDVQSAPDIGTKFNIYIPKQEE